MKHMKLTAGLLAFALLLPAGVSGAGAQVPDDLPQIEAQTVGEPEKKLPDAEFEDWLKAIRSGELSGTQLQELLTAVQEASGETAPDEKQDPFAELPAGSQTSPAEPPAGSPASSAEPAADSQAEAVPPEEKKDPNELSAYAGMTFDEFLKQQPKAAEHGTVVGVKGFSLGGDAQEAGLSGKESDRIITRVNLYGGDTYHLFGITAGMAIADAEKAAEAAGFVLSGSEGGLFVWYAGAGSAAKEGSQLTVWSKDGETADTVTYDMAPGKYF